MWNKKVRYYHECRKHVIDTQTVLCLARRYRQGVWPLGIFCMDRNADMACRGCMLTVNLTFSIWSHSICPFIGHSTNLPQFTPILRPWIWICNCGAYDATFHCGRWYLRADALVEPNMSDAREELPAWDDGGADMWANQPTPMGVLHLPYPTSFFSAHPLFFPFLRVSSCPRIGDGRRFLLLDIL